MSAEPAVEGATLYANAIAAAFATKLPAKELAPLLSAIDAMERRIDYWRDAARAAIGIGTQP